MKAAILGIFCLFVGVLSQTPCKTTSDCAEGECCLSTAVFKGKRQADAFCRPRGDDGDSCYVNNEAFYGQEDNTMYYNGCPCLFGKDCMGSGVFEVPQGERGQCAGVTGKRQDVKSCTTVADCGSNECCVPNIQPIGKKRQLSGGTCKPLGAEGDSCLVAVTSVGSTNYACPCEAGLMCEGLKIIEVPLGERGQCTKATKDASCSTGADCAADECCISAMRPIGKKRQTGGQCQKRGAEGASCFMRDVGSDHDMYFECPCVSGLNCVGTGMMDIPLGEIGKCTA